ncbi:hypothetical protein O181_076656 [Austropuccinia psidii MF-1]|uniref:Integrase zinc-binding domain-containing protein n=1 Tax=Austropuccinia psidii MF-1 TaxID=1389203 RepID=A0A9Q3FAU2_9BASI|nr:hypothetical protein [Austropuccinia psidii MF-1]
MGTTGKNHIEGIYVADIGTEFFKKVKEICKMEKNCHISCQLLMKDCEDPLLSSKLDEAWKKAYDEGIFHILNGILYHGTKYTFFMDLTDRTLINTILHECHDSVASGNLSEDRTLERVKTCSWWPNWRKDVSEYSHTFDRFEKSNRDTGKKFGMMIQIQDPQSTWENVHMDWVTSLPPGGDRSYNACLVLVERCRNTPAFLPFHKYDTAMETAIMIWNNVISHKGLFQDKLSFSTSHPPQTDGQAERTIQKLEDMIRQFCSYDLELRDFDGFTHDWCTLIPALELAYKKSIHSSTGKAPAMLEEGWNPGIPYDTFKEELLDTHPTARSFKIMLNKARHHANRCMQDSFRYAKEKWNKWKKTQNCKLGDLVVVSTLNFNNIKVPKKLKYSFAGPFMIKALHGPNSLQLELIGN